MSTQAKTVARHYARIISQWPKDPMRPSVQLPTALQARLKQVEDGRVEDLNAEMRNVNALYSLLGDRYKAKYPLSQAFLEPSSNPTHYHDLIEELDVAPTRSWLGRYLNSFKGMVRFS